MKFFNPRNKISKISYSWFEISQKLSKCSSRELNDLISNLYILSTKNKDFIESNLIDNDKLLFPYKRKIKKYIGPNIEWGSDETISITKAKKVLSEYRKTVNDPMGLIDLMVCYVEYGTNFIYKYGDMYEQYYSSLESVFKNALKLMKKYEYKEIHFFIKRFKIVIKKSECVGWGYYDTISDMLDKAYPGCRKK